MLRKIMLSDGGELTKDGSGNNWILNFSETEGPFDSRSTSTPQKTTDGDDVIFGDLGNDWLVGGTGEDHLYGGLGDDLLHADDDLNTNGGLNDVADTDESYRNIAYGGGGRDVLIASTSGDRLIEWVGEFNSYLVPFSAFGPGTVSRALQPAIPEYLCALSASDRSDPTRDIDEGQPADDVRNGEPRGEIGLVIQKDVAWYSQTGAPDGPQPGNIPGGTRDVLRSANFNDGTAGGFAADSGTWSATESRYQVAPTSLGGEAVSVFYVDEYIPVYFEMSATIRAVKPTGGYKANAYLVFDYQSPTDFKFAGVNVSTNQLEMGYRDAQGWHVVVQTPYTTALRFDTDYNVFLALNGCSATLIVDNRISLAYTFIPRVDATVHQRQVGSLMRLLLIPISTQLAIMSSASSSRAGP